VDPFLAEIRIFAGTFAPKGWALCNGQLLAISQNTALFSLLGTTYGGNGTSTFALPNLQGMAPMHAGQGPGLSTRDLGEQGGEPTVTLLQSELPNHSHALMATNQLQQLPDPANHTLARANANAYLQNPDPTTFKAMNPSALSTVGGSQPHNNMPPYLTLNFIIALQGVFPARS
jgi:microcystin-dependent protein